MNSNPFYLFHEILIAFSFVLFGCSPAGSQTNIELTPWGESHNQPIDMAPWVNDDFILIEKAGKVKTIDEEGNQLNMILDIKDHIANAGGERGLLGIALHPAYPDTPYIYLNHTDENNSTAVVRYEFFPESDEIDPKTRKVLLTVDQPYGNHNGGCIRFGPDGYLYIGMGDGGSAGDPENRAQNLTSLLGKMLRIDVDKGNPYAIPENNPFKNVDNAQPEIWSWGWRNPWRFSFDRENGDMWVGDVGQNAVEEISYEAADAEGGLNYGWRCYEGDQRYNTDDDCDGSYVDPVITRKHTTGDRSITGGYRYRGPVDGMENRYFFADYVSGNVYMAVLKDSESAVVKSLETIDKKNSIASFAQDKEGNLFAISLSGQIYKIFLNCEISTPEFTQQSTDGDSIALQADSTYEKYIWHYHADSDDKALFKAIDTTESPIFFSHQNGNYYVTVVDQDGCQAGSEILSVMLTATEAVDFYNIKVYPNPASDHLTIETEESLTNAIIEIRNSTGQLIRKMKSSLPGSVSLRNIPTGMYFLKFLVGQKTYVTKILKN
ncbi:PQQ-dependent sugar dehydrogenase [Membranicola marinus]|uniref:PQQ-dependent sugar dehydrogenase n=1 Tax=Membranihabitans marinus TaxID=1227546 RepID=A0A953LB04_9BACT|nr:PQQ-dependent sugar dehydrogenase [Membranihabitans marinus]MBY5958106.1 PQQ-dependent sugar dehydrogenase [Membranihabitans marinus]